MHIRAPINFYLLIYWCKSWCQKRRSIQRKSSRVDSCFWNPRKFHPQFLNHSFTNHFCPHSRWGNLDSLIKTESSCLFWNSILSIQIFLITKRATNSTSIYCLLNRRQKRNFWDAEETGKPGPQNQSCRWSVPVSERNGIRYKM